VLEFYNLADEYLPEEKAQIERLPLIEAVRYFISRFSECYFDISSGADWLKNDERLYYLVRYIPVQFEGLIGDDCEDYDNMNGGMLLARVICDSAYFDDNRAPLLAESSKILGECVNLIPIGGWPVEKLEEVLGKSPWPGLRTYCQYIHARTGNVFLDTNYEDYSGEVEWCPENVELFTADWQLSKKLRSGMKKFDDWLTKDIHKRATKVINWILKNIDIDPEQKGKPLMEVFNGEEG
jgi:hypothetical protein